MDFERAEPTEGEKEVYQQVAGCLGKAPQVLAAMKVYKGAGQEIREAIGQGSSEEHQVRAWRAVTPLVQQLREFYDFSTELEESVLHLLAALTSADLAPSQHLETQQALTKQFAEILHFTLSFDDLKMNNPAIQNDLSYFRRTRNRLKMDDSSTMLANGGDIELPDDVGNRMSLFYANPTPMLNTISMATTKFTQEHPGVALDNTTDVLSTMSAVCRVMIENPEYSSRFELEDTVLFCLRVMVGVIILYDHIHPVGAFAKTTNIDVHGPLKLLKEHPKSSESLLNALRYNTKHLNDEATPKSIRSKGYLLYIR